MLPFKLRLADRPMSPSTATPNCELKARFLKEITDALKLMISYHHVELERLSRGESPAFDQAAYDEARRIKTTVEAALLQHRKEHGC